MRRVKEFGAKGIVLKFNAYDNVWLHYDNTAGGTAVKSRPFMEIMASRLSSSTRPDCVLPVALYALRARRRPARSHFLHGSLLASRPRRQVSSYTFSASGTRTY